MQLVKMMMMMDWTIFELFLSLKSLLSVVEIFVGQ